MSKDPKISIITACYNAEETIEQTIQSVLNQTYDLIEYIIVDGASTDRTMEIVRKYENDIDIIISEPDQGVYDAFNKGAKVATGDYIQYLNADDYLYDENVIKDVSKFIKNNNYPILIYGGVLLLNEVTGYKRIKNENLFLSDIKKGRMIPHQATFIQKGIFLDFELFNLKYSIAADFDLVCKVYKKYSNDIQHLDRIISVFRLGGLSSDLKNREILQDEYQEILKYHFNNNMEKEKLKNEDYLKRWIEKILFNNKRIGDLLIQKNIKKVVLWGAGEFSLLIYKDLIDSGLEIPFFIDTDSKRQGMCMNGIPILSPNVLNDRHNIDCILMSFEGNHEESVIQYISKLNLFNQIEIISWRDLVMEL